MTKLLHIEKFMPKGVIDTTINMQKGISVDKLVFSRHVQEHFAYGNYKHGYTKEGILRCMEELKTAPVEPFEVELVTEGKKTRVTKYVVRMPYDKNNDVSIAIRGSMVVTAWLNHHTDTHKTLDLSKYHDSI